MSKFKKKINKAVLGTATSMSILTGCAVDNRVNDNINIVSETDVQGDMIVDIDSSYKKELSKVTGKDLDYDYTVNDLKMIGPNLDVIVVGDYSLDWLNYCDNVQSLLIRLENEDAKDVLKDVEKMDNLSFFHLVNYDGTFFCGDDLPFLDKDKIKGLFLYGNLVLDQDFLYDFNNLLFLSFCGESAFNFNINGIEKLDNLSSVFFGNAPYDTAIYVDMDDYNRLIVRGIDVIFDEDENEDKFLNANRKLSDIASSLELDTDISDEEKLKRIILYTLDNFNYSDEVREALNNEDIPDVSRFYDGGDLKAIIEGEGDIICGNYAAIVGALVRRSGMNSYTLRSHNHAYNLVSVDCEYYYVDATALDAFNYYNDDNDFVRNVLEDGDTSSLGWYMKRYESNEYLYRDYTIANTSYEDIDNMIIDINENRYEINMDNERRIVNASVLVGILMGLGCAKRAYNKNIQKKRRMAKR